MKTPPIKLIDQNPKWLMTSDGEVYGIEYDCPCGDARSCPHNGRTPVTTKTSFHGAPVCRSSAERGWDLTGTSWETITLSPSIRVYELQGSVVDDHWHGYLRNGVLESC